MTTVASQISSEPKAIETLHEDMIHDAQLDYYGRKLATCSSDRTIKIFDVVDGSATGQGEVLRGHEGPVWQVAWAHPKFGGILASASYDGRVIIWKEGAGAVQQAQQSQNAYGQSLYGQPQQRNVGGASGWSKIKEHAMHSASVNSISWAPHELGAVLACASSDGSVSVLTFNDDGTWAVEMVTAHPIGCNAVSWAPAVVPGSLISAQQSASTNASGQTQLVRRFASAGCDNTVKIWEYNFDHNRWMESEQLSGHSDWVRDVAFAPNVGLPRSYLASASQDRTVFIWTQDSLSSPWTKTALNPVAAQSPAAGSGAQAAAGKFPDTVWRVSWSVSGNVLAVSCGDGKISLWKENLKGSWECVSEMDS